MAKASSKKTKKTKKRISAAKSAKPAAADIEVVIVGAGPVGLALAKGLALDGRRVLVLEKKPRLSEHSKALTIWPRTQEVLDRMGLTPTFETNSLIRDRLRMLNADVAPPEVLVDLPLFELSPETDFARLLLIPQNETERLLFESLAQHENVRVDFSATVTTIEDSNSMATVCYVKDGVELSVRGRFVVGCDGAHSAVRGALGFHLEGETYPIKAGLADVRLKGGPSYDFPRLTSKAGLCFAVQASKELWRLIFIDRSDRQWNLEDLSREAVQNIFGDIEYELVWTSDFKLHRRTSEKFAKGHLVLAGDAAHLNSPVGGQGMNSGIQDTEVLRKALGDALSRNSTAPILDYASKRKSAVESGVNQFTGLLTKAVIFNDGKYLKTIARALGVVLRLAPPVRHAFLRRAAMID